MKGIERKISANIIPLLVFLLLPAILLPFASTCPAATFGWMPGRVGDFHGPNWYEDGVDPPVENVLIPLRSAVGYIEKGGTVLFKGGSFDDGYITLYRGATFNMTGGSLGSSADNGVMLRMGDKLRRGGDFLLRGGTCNFENLDIYGSTFRQTGGTIKVSHGELLLGQQGKLEITGGMFRCNQMVNWGDFRAGDSAKVLIERWIGSNAGHAVFSGNARVALGMANIRSLAITDSSVKVKANSLAVGDWEVRTNYQAPRGTTILISASASGQGALIVNRVKGGGIENTHFITSSPMEMGKSVSVYTSYSQDRGCTSVGFLDNGAIGTITVKKGLTQACSPVLYVRELHIGRNARLSYYGKLYYGKLVVEPGGELVPAGPGAKSCRADPPVTRYLAVTIDPPEAGSVRGAGGKIHCPRNCSGQFPDGFTTYLTAETKSGYVFDHWEGPLTTRTNPLPVALDFGDESYRAVYKSLFPPDDTGHGRLGDPVNTATGEHYFNLPVFDLGGPLPLSFHLTYGSSLHDRPNISETFGGTLGHNWMHNFQATRIVDSKTHTRIVYDRGKTLSFHAGPSAGEWLLDKGEKAPYQLRSVGKRFVLMDPEKELVYAFDAAGRLDFIEDRNGSRLNLTYDPAGRLLRVGDGLGRRLSFSYDGSRLTDVCDGYGRCASFGYSRNGLLTQYTDVLGHTTRYAYDTSTDKKGLLTGTTLPEGNRPFTQTYNAKGAVTSQADAYGNVHSLEIATNGVSTMAHADGTTLEHRHSGDRDLTAYTDQRNFTAHVGYDNNHRISSVTDRMGNEVAIRYDPASGKESSLMDSQGNTARYVYKACTQTIGGAAFVFSDLVRAVNPDGTIETFVRNDRGNMVARRDGAGGRWRYGYNSRGQTTLMTNPAGGVSRMAYNEDGTVASSTDTDTGRTEYRYDRYKRIQKIVQPDGNEIRITRDLKDRVTAVRDENGHVVEYVYSANGNLITIKDAEGNETAYAYDLLDRVLTVTNGLGKATTMAYDSMGRLKSLTDANQLETVYRHEKRGWLTGVTQGGETWETEHDDEGVVASRSTPLGLSTSYQTDHRGYLTGITDPLGATTTLKRDAMGRLVTFIDPLSRVVSYGYDGLGLFKKVTLPVIGPTTYERNGMGLLKSITDPGGNVWSFSHTPMGRLKSAADPLSATWEHSYDSRGNLSDITYPDGKTLTVTRDPVGNVTRRLYSDGTDLQFGYDARNLPTSSNAIKLERDAEGRVIASESEGAVFGTAYDDGGRIKSTSYANGAFSVTYTYDPGTGLLANVADDLTHTSVSFFYDGDRRLIGIERSNGVNGSYEWDEAGRLTHIREGSLIDGHITRDASGQVTNMMLDAPLNPDRFLVQDVQILSFDAASRISSKGYRYDPRGRLILSPGHTFTWDGASRLVELDDVQLGYNGFGDLVLRTSGTETTRYFHNYAVDTRPILAERNEADLRFLRYYVWTPEGSLLYMIDGGQGNSVYFHHFDPSGSTLALTNAEGALTDAYAYNPYGILLRHEGNNPQPFTFVGQYGVRQEGAGGAIYQMRERYYDASTCRFLSRESDWPQTVDPRMLNPYQYAFNNPISFVDVTGRGPVREFFKKVWNLIWPGAKSRAKEGGKKLVTEGAEEAVATAAEFALGPAVGGVVELLQSTGGGAVSSTAGLLFFTQPRLGDGTIHESIISEKDLPILSDTGLYQRMSEAQVKIDDLYANLRDPGKLWDKHDLSLARHRMSDLTESLAIMKQEANRRRIIGLRELPWKLLRERYRAHTGQPEEMKQISTAAISKSIQEGDFERARLWLGHLREWESR